VRNEHSGVERGLENATTDTVIGIAVVFVADITMDTLDLPPLAMRHCWRQFSQDYPKLLLKELIDRSIA
jgi:hypothetical protein